MNLIIFADDLTGTLDTGVQFAKAGIRTSYYSCIEALTSSLADWEADVYLFDTESRHLSPKAAYQKLFEAAEAVHAYHPDLILKKTDSGLRGNIGSELTAVMDAVQTPVLHFFPAYPRMGRPTENGIQYIDGTPVSQSTFGNDPFEPVTRDSAVTIAASGGKAGWSAPGSWNGQDGIVVWDARDDEELVRRAAQVWDLQRRSGQTAVWAGCAGVAEVLANLLPFPKRDLPAAWETGKIAVICGSVSNVSRRQAEAAQQAGFYRVVVPTDGMEDGEPKTDGMQSNESENGRMKIGEMEPGRCRQEQDICGKIAEELSEAYRTHPGCIADTGFPGMDEIQLVAEKRGQTPQQSGRQVSRRMAGIAAALVREPGIRLMIIGGDTLQAFLELLGTVQLSLLGECAPGVVRIQIKWENNTGELLVRSGSFGAPKMLTELAGINWQTAQELPGKDGNNDL